MAVKASKYQIEDIKRLCGVITAFSEKHKDLSEEISFLRETVAYLNDYSNTLTPDNEVDYFSLRVNRRLKEDFYKYCKTKGFTAGKAIKLLARQFTKSGKIPFSLDIDRKYSDENLIRISLHMDAETRQDFSKACEEYGLPMSIVVRGFMDYCVNHDCFPYDMESGGKETKGTHK